MIRLAANRSFRFTLRSRNFLPHLWASLFLNGRRAESYSPASPRATSNRSRELTGAREVIIKFRRCPEAFARLGRRELLQGRKETARARGRRASSRSRTASIWPTPRST